jgi:enoyl-CoA hydratase
VARAKELILTGRVLTADEAERIGLVLRTVDDDQLLPAAREIAERIISNVPIGVWSTKQSLWINQGVGSLESACEIEARSVYMAQQTEDAAEKRRSFLEKRKPVFANK